MKIEEELSHAFLSRRKLLKGAAAGAALIGAGGLPLRALAADPIKVAADLHRARRAAMGQPHPQGGATPPRSAATSTMCSPRTSPTPTMSA